MRSVGHDAGAGAMVPEILVPEILVEEPRWRRLVPGLERLVRRAAIAAGGAGSVVLSTDRAVRALNRCHRGRDKPTNVLSFPAASAGPHAGGDLILAYGVVRREAAAARRRAAHHLAHLVVHGTLHLHGHDHHHAGEGRRMERAETRILHRLGLPDPWRPR